MAENTKKPAVRFAGFTEAWEQREFGELVVIERGGSPRPIDDYITDSPDGLNWVTFIVISRQGNKLGLVHFTCCKNRHEIFRSVGLNTEGF